MKRLNTALDSMMVLFVLCVVVWVLALGYAHNSDEEAEAIHSREWVAQQYCGQNSVVRWENDVPQCLTKHGKPVKVASK